MDIVNKVLIIKTTLITLYNLQISKMCIRQITREAIKINNYTHQTWRDQNSLHLIKKNKNRIILQIMNIK